MGDKDSTQPVENKSPEGEAPPKGPVTSNAGDILPASHWEKIEDNPNVWDAGSAYNDAVSSTASLSSSIHEYRKHMGRTYARDIGESEAWAPNDERHINSMNIHHYAITRMFGNKLFLAPLEKEKVKNVLDIGTGTGVWAIDFGDEFPDAQVVGTDVSPIQPSWVPPNVRFEIDDANVAWTWPNNKFDYLHVRGLLGCIADWSKFYKEAFRVTAPGGWMEHHEEDAVWYCHNKPLDENSPMGQWGKVFREAGNKWGRTFFPISDDIQKKCMEEAGFVDIRVINYQAPIGEWPTDPEEKQTGIWFKSVLTSDLEGYVNYVWAALMGWKPEEIKVYLSHLRRQMRDPSLHTWYPHRIVIGRKPAA